jgi:phage baseplate assembly protein W
MTLYGPKWPLKSGNADTFEMYDNIEQQIGFYLKNLLLTSPGENISDPNYGIGIRRFLFEQNIDYVRSSISSRVSSQVSVYLSYLSVSDIQVFASPQDVDNNSMTIRLVYEIPGDVTQKVFELDLKPETTIGFY